MELTEKERKKFEKACETGGYIAHKIYDKLKPQERKMLYDAKELSSISPGFAPLSTNDNMRRAANFLQLASGGFVVR
eukprot:744841-Ditylum_brightwellii.AAC.1